jgi:cardiolipin synthase
MIGGRKMRRLARRKPPLYRRDSEVSVGRSGLDAELILRSFGVPASTQGNEVRIITGGVEAYSELLRLIDGARETIHLTTYVLSNDAVGKAIVGRLARRASEGVAVRLLLDSVGSLWLRRRTIAPLERAGGRVAYFMPVLHIPFRGRSNLRNHRKIIVADGRVAMTGGMNLAVEYLGPIPDPSRWKDVAMVIEGPAVVNLEELFWSDWHFATGEAIPPPPVPPASPAPPGALGTDIVQIVASGPDVEGDPLYESLITLLFSAKQRIWVLTPYFVPDEILVRALDLAARRGVDVRIMVPHRSNHRSADLARVGYLRQVDQAGGRVLRFRGGMLHMDMRSLFLNYEVSLFLYSPDRIQEIEGWFLGLEAHCRQGLSRPHWLRELGENVVRLLSPLL